MQIKSGQYQSSRTASILTATRVDFAENTAQMISRWGASLEQFQWLGLSSAILLPQMKHGFGTHIAICANLCLIRG
jgi:hypothetical protein